MNKNLPEYIGIKAGAASARINAGLSDRIGVLVIASAATTITLSQHTAATGGTSKDLETDNYSYFKADGQTKFTITRPEELALDAEFVVPGAGIFYVEVESSQLDTNGGFAYVSAAGATSTVLLMAVDMRHVPAYQQDL